MDFFARAVGAGHQPLRHSIESKVAYCAELPQTRNEWEALGPAVSNPGCQSPWEAHQSRQAAYLEYKTGAFFYRH